MQEEDETQQGKKKDKNGATVAINKSSCAIFFQAKMAQNPYAP